MFKMEPMFKAFLKMEGIYLAFILNVLSSGATARTKFKILRGLRDPDKFVIDNAFDWVFTAEGYDSWKSVSDKWVMFYFVMRTNGYMKPHSTDLD
jgi:hypothetical protein